MKKMIFVLFLVLCMAFTLLACDHDHENPCIEAECCEAHIGDGNCHCHGHCGTSDCDCHGAH